MELSNLLAPSNMTFNLEKTADCQNLRDVNQSNLSNTLSTLISSQRHVFTS